MLPWAYNVEAFDCNGALYGSLLENGHDAFEWVMNEICSEGCYVGPFKIHFV